MEGELTCKNCMEKYDTEERVPHTLPCGHSLCTFCLDETLANESECIFCQCFIDNININTRLMEEVRALEIAEQESAELYSTNISVDTNTRTHLKYVSPHGNPVLEMTSYIFSKGSKVKESYYLSSPETESARTERQEYSETQTEIHNSKTLKDTEKATHGEISAESTSSVADKEGISQIPRDDLSTEPLSHCKSSLEHEATRDSPRLGEEKEMDNIRDKKTNAGVGTDYKESCKQKTSYDTQSSSLTDYAQNICISTIQVEEIKEDKERGLLPSETSAGSCPLHDWPNIAYCVTCDVMVCKECLITVHNDTSGKSRCEIASTYQMMERFISESNEYVDADIELTKDLKLNMTGIILYLHKNGNAVTEKIAKLKEELKCLEESLEKNNAMKSEVQKNEDHLTEWISAIEFYKRTFSRLYLSSNSASEMKEIVQNRECIQDQLSEHSVFVEEFKQKHPKFSFDVVHLTEFDTKTEGQCDEENITDDIVVVLNDGSTEGQPESDIKQQFSTSLSCHDTSNSSLNMCVLVNPDDQNVSKCTAGNLEKNNQSKSFTQILGFFPDMSATSTPLPDTFESVCKETASKETTYFSSTTESQKSEDLLGTTDTNQIVSPDKRQKEKLTSYKQDGSQSKSKNKTKIKSPSKLLADTPSHISNPSLAENFQKLSINVTPAEIKPESGETEILNTEKHLTSPSNPSDQKVMQTSAKDAKQESSKTNKIDNLTVINPILGPQTSQGKSKAKKKSKAKSRSKNKMNVSDTDPKHMPESSVASTQDAETKKAKPLQTNPSQTQPCKSKSPSIPEKQEDKKQISSKKKEKSAVDPTQNKCAKKPLGKKSKNKETKAKANSQMVDYSCSPILKPNFTIPRAKLLDAVQSQPPPLELDLKVLDPKDDQGLEEQSEKSHSYQDYGATSSINLLPSSQKMSDMKGPSISKDSVKDTGGNLQKATAAASKSVNRTLPSGTKSKSKSKSKIKTDANLDHLGIVMEKCLNITSHPPDTSESAEHKLDDSEQNPSKSTHRASHESLSSTEQNSSSDTMDTPHISQKEGAIPKSSTNTGKGINKENTLCGAVLLDSNDNDLPKTLTSSSVSFDSDPIGLFLTPSQTSESTNRSASVTVQDSVSSTTSSLTINPKEESVKKHTISSKPTIITVESGSELMRSYLLQCLKEAMSKTKGYFKCMEETSSLEKEGLTEDVFHEKMESLEDDEILSDTEDSSQTQSLLRKLTCLPMVNEWKAPGSSRSSTKEHLKEIALQISRVLNVASAEVSANVSENVATSATTTTNDNTVSEYKIEALPEEEVIRFPSAEIIDEETYQTFKMGVLQAVKLARAQAKRIAKAGSLEKSLIPAITQALITVASKNSKLSAGSSQTATSSPITTSTNQPSSSRSSASTNQPSVFDAVSEGHERREKRISNRQKMRQEAMKTNKAD